ncbi:50S ribosomal protein L23 [Candidatus Kinetoplastibacterium sorsogonicusi]|uniref:Large ribosomal subunit protein uL23 n=1 Tax=Candidatus Kinetoplastidibacterium kentomonadis TaxID=1576550 RepID=A0A3Q8EU23_9PROT|nr:50S ribosomal protein L23 [Candidatus Kinetoplastibacterium sorsogonicusi]AWD32795.1 50S ribosomal protein L23 [Candidatus Kinetoplastibacterium sorsogonicusi]
MNIDRLMKIMISPLITEKATQIAEKNKQFAFLVVPDATKLEIKNAVEMLFKVQVKSVSVINIKGKLKRVGKFMGRRKDQKKAYVKLMNGQEINFTEVV